MDGCMGRRLDVAALRRVRAAPAEPLIGSPSRREGGGAVRGAEAEPTNPLDSLPRTH